MSASFLLAKNGSKSAKANGVLLHSAYNPQIEGERFAQNAAADFIPKHVVVIEGALGYCVQPLRNRFCGAKISTIRFGQDFNESDNLWDAAFNLQGQSDGKENDFLAGLLFDFMGEEGLYQCLFLEWPPSARAWPKETKEAWNQIKAAMQKAKILLATHEHFAKRWLKNKAIFFERLERTLRMDKIQSPVLICASGPSLEESVNSIKKVRSKIFVCALSSAAGVLAYNKIQPDLVLSEDGGWWAKKHLDILRNEFLDVPLALEPESACPSVLLQKKEILPLCYDDDEISKKIFGALGLEYVEARRNGTVSGSAMELFLSLCKKEIYFAGLDLAPANGQSHARPNALQSEREEQDFRLRPKATRAAAEVMPSPSLEIYKNWFSACNLNGRKVFRIKGKSGFSNSLGQIKDINLKDFEEAIAAEKDRPQKNETSAQERPLPQKSERARTAREQILLWSQSDGFLTEIFPADSIIFRRSLDKAQKDERQKIIARKKQDLLDGVFGEKK